MGWPSTGLTGITNYGVPSSHGCINMTPEGAKWIYRWTDPVVPPGNYVYSGSYGTRVTVQ